ncbi:MAG TPA: BrnT family toxin [Rhizomicrobium sp.]
MQIGYDPTKREWTLRERGLDFDDAAKLFERPTLTQSDDRRDYGEVRFLTYGRLNGRLVLVVWTPRNQTRHIISMRKCNDREQKKITHRLGEG